MQCSVKPAFRKTVRWCCTMEEPVKSLITVFTVGYHVLPQAAPLWSTIRFTPVRPVRTHWFTQQPLGGKAQFGGQRFGEMEVWALECLRRCLYPAGDSDGQVGRRCRTCQDLRSNCQGANIPQSGVPESFKVLVKELQSLGLDIKVLDKAGEEIDLKQSFEDEEDVSFRSAEEDDRYSDPDAFSCSGGWRNGRLYHRCCRRYAG